MKRITVMTRDALLGRRIALIFRNGYAVTACDGAEEAAGGITVVDLDAFPEGEGDVYLCRSEREGALRIPFLTEELIAEVEGAVRRTAQSIGLISGRRAVRLRGEVIHLTEVEHRLITVLLRAPKGEYVGKEKLISEVWGGECDGGVVNVYIHYLREKLEKNGEKIIVCSRREGYKIDEKIERTSY